MKKKQEAKKKEMKGYGFAATSSVSVRVCCLPTTPTVVKQSVLSLPNPRVVRKSVFTCLLPLLWSSRVYLPACNPYCG
jgi:hypothetical protein